MIKVRFWGVRGSIPSPGPQTIKYGGNTACIELCFPEVNRRIILDAGSGIRGLAAHILQQDLARGPVATEIFLTHTHWDHIMGFPFFTPAYMPETRLKILGPVARGEDSLADIIGSQMKYHYFPVDMAEMAANISYERLQENARIDIGDGIMLATAALNHPITTLGYRFTYRGTVFCTAYDTEPLSDSALTPLSHPTCEDQTATQEENAALLQNQAIEDFFAGADLLVHDAQYTMQEYQDGKIGWGHSPMEHAIITARREGVKRLALFHHDPDRSDAELDELGRTYCNFCPGEPGQQGDKNNSYHYHGTALNHTTEIFFAREGMEIEIE